MRFLLFGIIGLAVAYLAALLFVRANPATIARRVKPLGIGAAAILALFLVLTGRFMLARQVIAAAMSVLAGGGAFSGYARRGPSAGGQSKVRTQMLDMELDHESGEMHGTILSGRFAGATLGALSENDLIAFHQECCRTPDQSQAILEAYLDRMHPDWQADKRFANEGQTRDERRGAGGPMSAGEALEILGLGDGAGPDDVKKAHKRLMKVYHPDQGGSDYLAAKINQAKDVLLED